MLYREFAVVPTTLDEAKRTVDATFATETPVSEFDYERYEYVPTVLLMSGCQLPKDRSLVMLDNHNRHGQIKDNIKGSGQDCKVEDRQLIGTLSFSSLAVEEWELVKEGHLRGVSIGRTDEKAMFIPDGQSERLDGRTFKGPIRVVTSWTPREISLVPVGADPNALLRGEQIESGREQEDEPNPREPIRSAQQETVSMNAILKALLVSRGLKADATNEEAIAFLVERGLPIDHDATKIGEWVTANLSKLGESKERGAKPEGTPPASPSVNQEDLIGRAVANAIAQAEAEKLALRKSIADHLKARAETLNWDQETIDRIANTATGIQDADSKVIEELAARQGPAYGAMPRVSGGVDQAEKVESLLSTALTMRTLQSTVKDAKTLDEVFPKEKRFQGWEQFRHAPMIQLARVMLESRGVRNVGWMSPEEIAKSAMFGERHSSGMRVRSGAYHTPGSFQYVLMDAVNKNVQASYMEAPSTCEAWVRIAPSVTDFKSIHVLKLGATPNLQDWDGYSPLPQTSFKDEKETYAVAAKAERVSISWMTIVNDDQNVLQAIPSRLGNAARRTRNQLVYAQIATGTSGYGRTMSDGQQLFSAATGNRAYSNLTTGAGAPSVSTVQTVTAKMMAMRGLNSPEEAAGEDILGIQPAFIIVPVALRTTALQLVRSTADPAAGGNSGVYNPTQGLIPIVEPYLDGQTNGTTAWYLASRWQDCPHVELTHLVGQETPLVESWIDDNTKAIVYDVIQSMAACAVEHRGIQKHVGA